METDAPEAPESFFRRKRGTLIFWVLVLGLMMFNLPALKGCYYGMVDSSGPPQGINWRANWDAAAEESARTGKPILAYFSASWCPPCRIMKREVWPDADVQAAANGKVIPIYMDVDQPAAQEKAAHYRVSGIPTLLITQADGTPLRAGGMMSKRELVAMLEDAAGMASR
jgi:protein disulfide-isomerase